MITDQQALDWVKEKMQKEIAENNKKQEKINKEQLKKDKIKEIALTYIPLREAEQDEEKRKQLAYKQNEEVKKALLLI